MSSKPLLTDIQYEIFKREYYSFYRLCVKKRKTHKINVFYRYLKLHFPDFRSFSELQIKNQISAGRNKYGNQVFPSIERISFDQSINLDKLINNSISAMIAAIELHNKPVFQYRYETTVVLVINAWELLLKAYIIQNIPDKSLFDEEGESKSFKICIQYVQNKLATKFSAIKENLEALYDYRCKFIHFFDDQFDVIVFSLLKPAISNYIKFLKNYFEINLPQDDNFMILPLGFKAPLTPMEYISKTTASPNASAEVKEFLTELGKRQERLESEGVDDTFMLEIKTHLVSEKKITKADFTCAVSNRQETEAIISLGNKELKLSDKPGLPEYCPSLEEIRKNYPLEHRDLFKKLKMRYIDFIQNDKYRKILKKYKSDLNFSFPWYSNPLRPSNPKYLYKVSIIDEFSKYYKTREEN